MFATTPSNLTILTRIGVPRLGPTTRRTRQQYLRELLWYLAYLLITKSLSQ